MKDNFVILFSLVPFRGGAFHKVEISKFGRIAKIVNFNLASFPLRGMVCDSTSRLTHHTGDVSCSACVYWCPCS